MARWAQDHATELAAGDPDMGTLVNRFADNWRPLFAIADVIGDSWPAHAREIATAAAQAMVDESISAQLLADIRWVFDGCPDPARDETSQPTDRLASAFIVERLVQIDGRPWAEWRGGKPLTQNTLARHLSRFNISSGTIRLSSGQTAKGYYRAAFDEAFAVYIPPQTGFQSVTASQLNNDGHCDGLQSVTPHNLVTVSKASQLNNDGHCDGVTLSTPRREAIEL
jgi:hypothetical protein